MAYSSELVDDEMSDAGALHTEIGAAQKWRLNSAASGEGLEEPDNGIKRDGIQMVR